MGDRFLWYEINKMARKGEVISALLSTTNKVIAYLSSDDLDLVRFV